MRSFGPALVRWLLPVVLGAGVLAGCGDQGTRATGSSTQGASAGTAARGGRAPESPAPRRLTIGVDEQNPWLITPGAVPDGFGPWRDRVATIRPQRYRLFVDWSNLQPDPAKPADLAQPNDGCLRGLPPCGAYAGVRDRLRAIAARQQADGGGWEVMVVLYGAPDWAARKPSGCERPGTKARSRPYSKKGLAGYRALIRGLLALGREEGVKLRWWSPLNEPNYPQFISPQRKGCSATSTSLAPQSYASIVRAARSELAADDAPHDLVLGEMASRRRPSKYGTGITELIRALPDDVACAATAWSQHQYARADRGQYDAVGELRDALDERPCTRGKPIWVTESGVGGNARAGRPRGRSKSSLRAQCAAQAALLEDLDKDPRVRAVFQFSLREDTAFRVGLFNARLTRAYPTLGLWRAWSRATAAGGPAPKRPPDCKLT